MRELWTAIVVVWQAIPGEAWFTVAVIAGLWAYALSR